MGYSASALDRYSAQNPPKGLTMKKAIFALCLMAALAGCGHKRVDYSPSADSMNRQSAVGVVERAFYEDAGKTRPESVTVTPDFILLSDGIVSKGSSFGSAAPLGNTVIAASDSTYVTKAAGQRIYFDSIADTGVYQHKVKRNRFVVILRGVDGGQIRTVRLRTLQQAEQFADALAYLRQHKD